MPTPDKTIYVDANAPPLTCVTTSTGGKVADPFWIAYQKKPTWRICFVTVSGQTTTGVDVSEAVTWEAAIAKDFTGSTVMVRTLDADIDDSQADDGIIDVVLDAFSAEYLTIFNAATAGYIEGWIRIKGLNIAGEIKFEALFKVQAWGDPDPAGGTPPGNVSLYYTKTEATAIFQPKFLSTQLSLPTGATAINLGASATYRAAKIKGAIDDGSKYTIIEGDIIHNGSAATPYVDLRGDLLDDIQITADISGGQLRLILTNIGATKKLVYGIQDLIGVST